MARGRAVRLAVVGVLSLAVLAVGPGSAASGVLTAKPCKGADCGVVGDPHDAAYVGNGGLLLPASQLHRQRAGSVGRRNVRCVPLGTAADVPR